MVGAWVGQVKPDDPRRRIIRDLKQQVFGLGGTGLDEHGQTEEECRNRFECRFHHNKISPKNYSLVGLDADYSAIFLKGNFVVDVGATATEIVAISATVVKTATATATAAVEISTATSTVAAAVTAAVTAA